jgi:hypothetical protein
MGVVVYDRGCCSCDLDKVGPLNVRGAELVEINGRRAFGSPGGAEAQRVRDVVACMSPNWVDQWRAAWLLQSRSIIVRARPDRRVSSSAALQSEARDRELQCLAKF